MPVIPSLPNLPAASTAEGRTLVRGIQDAYRILANRLEGIFLVGTLAQRPSALGIPRFYFATDTDELYYDDGTWQLIGAGSWPTIHRSTLTLANGDNNNVAPTTGFATVAGPTGAFAITGITGGQDGREQRIYNPLNQTMTIKNENAGSTAANRITTLTGGDLVLRATAPSFVTLIYDTGASRWILESAN